MKFFKGVIVLIVSGMVFSCSHKEPETLTVRTFHLQDTKVVGQDFQMTRGEQLYRFRGAVTMEEKRNRLGHYYSVDWVKPAEARSDEKMQLVMNYQQAATGAKVLTMKRDLPEGETSGKGEFQVAGESYRVGGRVLAWQIQLMQGGKVLAEKRSYLWR